VTPDVVVDIGNTRMKWGLCRDGRVARMAAIQSLNPDAWTAKAERWGLARGTRWVVTSVNPKPVLPFFEWAKARGDTLRGIAVHEEIGLPVAVDQPERVGSDRLFNALAAVRRAPAGTPLVTVSVGTAMTIDFVSADGVFLGGQILPGPRTMARSLRDYTAALPFIEAEPAPLTDYCGKNTTDAINCGINSAIAGAVFNATWSFCDDVKRPAWAFVTGGDVRYLSADHFPDGVTELVFDPRLTLEGIRLAAEALP
jgi:type III pantothenate kinase